MRVYVVLTEEEWHGESLYGVFSTEERAREFAAKHRASVRAYDLDRDDFEYERVVDG